MFFDSIIKLERVPTVFPQKKFDNFFVQTRKKCGIQGEEVFSKNFSLKPQKSVEYRMRGLSLKKSSH